MAQSVDGLHKQLSDSDTGDEETSGQQSEQRTEPPSLKRPRSDSDDDGPVEKAAKDNHTSLVASHYNNLQEKGLYERSQSKIFYMRNFNNWIKSILIDKYLKKIKEKIPLRSPLRVMDMCSGKGGDLMKWNKGDITHLICTDIAEVSVEQCETRYKALSQRGKIFSAEFFAADATLQRLREKYKDPSMKLHLVSCQFAFHYSFESLKQAEIMLKNAAECLNEGGYFIGTIPDANEIMRRQRASGSDTIGNDIYKITFLCDSEQPPLFGAKYNFQLDGVVDCPEFLVHFPMLVKLALKYGLRLVEKKRFSEFYDESIGGGRGLIEKMQALETFPAQTRSDLDRQKGPEEYTHASEHIQRKGVSHAKVGTLSKSEWEACTLYMYFAFQKMKTSWDKEGKPVYS